MYQDNIITFILPTNTIIEELFEDLSMMSVAEYDINELLSLSVNAISVRNIAVDSIANYATDYHRLSKIGSVNEYNRDMEILSTAWLKFTTKLLSVYENSNIWDEQGTANMYFVRLIGSDMQINMLPKVY